MNVIFGPAGSAGMGNEQGIAYAHKLGLKAYEFEFTYGVKMLNPEAKKLGSLVKQFGIKASVHAPYFINLNSAEKKKIEASKKRILQSCERAHYLNASPVIFHAAFYGKNKDECYEIVKKNILELRETIKQNKWNVNIAPETTGKGSQFGTIDELLRLRKETRCDICVDFAHLYARNNGKIDYNEVFEKLKHVEELHCHFSGIVFSEKGERSHIPVEKNLFMPLANAIKKRKPGTIIIINESPYVFDDAVKMKKWFDGK